MPKKKSSSSFEAHAYYKATPIPGGQWGRFLMYICLICLFNTLFFVPASFEAEKDVLTEQEDHSLLEVLLEESGNCEKVPTPDDVPTEADDLVKKVEFVLDPFSLQWRSFDTQEYAKMHYSLLLDNPFFESLTPPPKG